MIASVLRVGVLLAYASIAATTNCTTCTSSLSGAACGLAIEYGCGWCATSGLCLPMNVSCEDWTFIPQMCVSPPPLHLSPSSPSPPSPPTPPASPPTPPSPPTRPSPPTSPPSPPLPPAMPPLPASPPSMPRPPMSPPLPPSLPLVCSDVCVTRNSAVFECSALLPLPCFVTRLITQAIGCAACESCCTIFPPMPPPSPMPLPVQPPPVPPPAPAFPATSCPWVNATSGQSNVLECWDGSRCNWITQGLDCCACRGGRAVCPPEAPIMCSSQACGFDHCCDRSGCAGRGGSRACPAVPIQLPPGQCTSPPPSPPGPPPVPPTPPAPPTSPDLAEHEWQQIYFRLMQPPGRACYWTSYERGVGYLAHSGHSSHTRCANRCLRTAGCTGFESPGDETYCTLWLAGACNNASAPGIHQGPASGPGSYLTYVRMWHPPPAPPAPPLPPLSPPPPSSCSASCGSGDSSLQCSALLSLSCADAEQIVQAIGCTACAGCCTEYSPSPPPLPSPMPSTPPPAAPPSPAFPGTPGSCPWINATSGENDVYVCWDGTRCNPIVDGAGCCDCRGGKSLCPLNVPKMCENRMCFGSYSHCCDLTCDSKGGPRACPSSPIALPPGHCTSPPPAPPNPPPAPPHPPWMPYVHAWQQRFEFLRPVGLVCRLAPYAEGQDYLLFQGTIFHGACANTCLRTPECSGFAVPTTETYVCLLWLRGACSNSSARGAEQSPASGPDSYLTYVGVMHPPPMPPLAPSAPTSPPPPLACVDSCGSGTSALHCSALLALSCAEARHITQAIGCTACDGCCAEHPPSPPPSPSMPPSMPPPTAPPAPAFPTDSCPWMNDATSGEVNVLVCWDGSRCNVFVEGATCCDCHGGKAMCSAEAPVMCEHVSCGLDHCCHTTCINDGGPRTCPSPPIELPTGHCLPPPPAPPHPPPAPPSPPHPPGAPYDVAWQQSFVLLEPIGLYCGWGAYTAGRDYVLFREQSSHSDCANRCLRMAECTGFEAPGTNSHCLLWLHGACSSPDALGKAQGPASGKESLLEYIRIHFPPPAPAAPPSPPLPPPPPVACSSSCESSNGLLRCSALLSLSCAEAQQITEAISCTACDGCCTEYPPSPPPSPSPPPLPPPPAVPPSPNFPAASCPWINATSGEINVYVCWDGTRCNMITEGSGCCDCHGGRAICPFNVPFMCARRKCGGGFDNCCGFTRACDADDGPRACPSSPLELPPDYCTPPPPAPPRPPPAPPSPPQPPLTPYDVEWQQRFNVLRPVGLVCDFSFYGKEDYIIVDRVTHADCANRCLRTQDCTGFEVPATGAYVCLIWLAGACSSPSAPGVTHGLNIGNASYLTYVRESPASALVQGIALPSSTVLLLVVTTAVLGILLRRSRHATRKLDDHCTIREIDANGRRTIRRVPLERHVKELIKLEPNARPGTSKPGPHEKLMVEELVFGKVDEAARGLPRFLLMPDRSRRERRRGSMEEHDLYSGLSRGVDAIVEEVRRNGTEVDKECLDYVLNRRAGSSSKTFKNSPYPRDCDEDGLRADRQTQSGEGMRLQDFVEHRSAKRADLTIAHVLALRLYTTAAYVSLNEPLRRREKHKLPVTVMFIDIAIKRLRSADEADRRSSVTSSAKFPRLSRAASSMLPPRLSLDSRRSRPSLGSSVVRAPRHSIDISQLREQTRPRLELPPGSAKEAMEIESSDRPSTAAPHVALVAPQPSLQRRLTRWLSRRQAPLVSADAAVDSASPEEELFDLWRGLKDRAVGEKFLAEGGTELAAMSTTCDLKVAIEYAASASSVLLRLCTSTVMQRGADLAFLSAFPNEAEMLFPPLTFLEPMGKHVIKTEDGLEFTIIDVVPHLA